MCPVNYDKCCTLHMSSAAFLALMRIKSRSIMRGRVENKTQDFLLLLSSLCGKRPLAEGDVGYVGVCQGMSVSAEAKKSTSKFGVLAVCCYFCASQ